MATIKSFTDLQQSKKLAEILPLESADMIYQQYETVIGDDYGYDYRIQPFFSSDIDGIPCWSLASLLEQLHYELCDDDGNSSYLQIKKEDDVYQLVYEDPNWEFESIKTDRHEHFIDACYELILKLNELNLL